MTIEEKAAAFDLLALVLTNQWADGTWTWWNPTPCGGTAGPHQATREEAVADLVKWAERMAKHAAKRARVALTIAGSQ